MEKNVWLGEIVSLPVADHMILIASFDYSFKPALQRFKTECKVNGMRFSTSKLGGHGEVKEFKYL